MHILNGRPMQGNRDSGIRENFACGIWNPELWTLELKESRILLKIGIQNPSSTDNERNPASKETEFLVSLEKLFQLEVLKRNARFAAEIRHCKKVKLSALPSAIEWSIYSKLGPHNILELFKWSLFMAAFRNIEIHKWLHKFLKMYETFTGRKATINPL